MFKIIRENKILVLLIAVSYARISFGYDCDCTCKQLKFRNRDDGAVCSFLENLSNAVFANEAALMNWNKHYNFVNKFSANWKKEITEVVREEIQNSIGDEHQSLKEGNIKMTSSPKKEDTLSLLEERFREMEAHLEKELAQQQETNGKLKRNIEGTQSTLIAVTKQILNLTSTANTTMNMLLTGYPSIVGELNEKMTYFVQNLNAEIKNLYELQNANALW